MLEFLREKASDRKLRLFACACCRRIWHLLTDERSQKAVEVAEKYADGLVNQDTLVISHQEAFEAHVSIMANYPHMDVAQAEATLSVERATKKYSNPMIIAKSPLRVAAAAAACATANDTAYEEAMHKEGAAQCRLIHDIFGNPFRSVSIDPAWLTPKVKSLAQSIYDNRVFNHLPILAEAIEDAGCHDADMLAHCRHPDKHVRGCWVVDLILGKESQPPANVEWFTPWKKLKGSGEALVAELQKELSPQHVLYGVPVVAVALRINCDDVLFAADDPSKTLAVVHLTWTGKVERDPRWPETTLYRGWQDWIDRCMLPDHQEYSE